METVGKYEDIHNHCLGCVKIWKCNARPHEGESCLIIPCELDCGARFHACKNKEHRLLCLNEKVPCINVEYGCPSIMPRKKLKIHLTTCPASVIYCTMEWNRWPIPAAKDQLFQHCHNQVFKKPQLDVALAMRDKRMLRKRWMQTHCAHSKEGGLANFSALFPAQKEQCLWENGTSVFAIEAHQSNGPAATVSEPGSCISLDCERFNTRQQLPFCGEPYRAGKKVADALNATINIIANGTEDEFEEDSGKCSLFGIGALKAVALPNGNEENKENIVYYSNHSTSVNNFNKCNYGIGSVQNSNISTPMDMSPPNTNCYLTEDSNKSSIADGDFMYEKVIEHVCDCDVVFANDTVVSDISSASILDHARKDVNPPLVCPLAVHPASSSLWYPSSVPPWCAGLGLDLNVESITRYKAQPKSMYTFLCAQEFRRDEYAWHYKNVHSEIHGGLNGWLEERCPLAQYGCTFGRRRFYPAPQGSSVVHNEVLESFGVKFPTHIVNTPINEKSDRYNNSMGCRIDETSSGISINEKDCSNNKINLSQMPFEVLQYIAGFLDSFSLCNLSLTSRVLRDVCRTLLEERGIVVFRWERQITPQGVSWKVASKRWFFSTSFSPIKHWCFEDGKNLSEHLKTCAFFNRNLRTDPCYFPMGTASNDSTYQKLKNGIADSSRNSFENITTKL